MAEEKNAIDYNEIDEEGQYIVDIVSSCMVCVEAAEENGVGSGFCSEECPLEEFMTYLKELVPDMYSRAAGSLFMTILNHKNTGKLEEEAKTEEEGN